MIMQEINCVERDLNKSRHTISRMPGKRHRKSLYCRHREQLWGDKKGNWCYWDGCVCLLFVCVVLHEEKKKNRMRELVCRFICLPTNMCELESHLWTNKEEISEEGEWKGCAVNDGWIVNMQEEWGWSTGNNLFFLFLLTFFLTLKQ